VRRRLALVLVSVGATALVAVTFRLVTDDARRDPTRASVDATTSPNDGAVRPSARVQAEPMQVPPFEASIEAVTAAQLHASWRPGCPVPVEELRAVNVSHWGLDGWVHTGRVVVHVDQADRIVAVMHDLYAAHFPIERMAPVDEYAGDDQASMRANNTSAFNCRTVAGTTRWSEHAYGRAIDVNPLLNPYVRGGAVDPAEGAPYADRSRTDLGMIHADDAAVRAFASQGWSWGGDWTSGQDYQHFSVTGR
jgi:hypothetical protein